jgi:hypothetical protein
MLFGVITFSEAKLLNTRDILKGALKRGGLIIMHKRGQAAMEFLMTYGWAILVVLVVIGALAYFGILNPSILLPERCELQMGVNCKDYYIDGGADRILIKLENGRGSDCIVTDLIANASTLGINCYNHTLTKTILNGRAEDFYLTCDGSLAAYQGRNSKHKWDLEMKWYSVGSSATYTHTMQGQLLARVE